MMKYYFIKICFFSVTCFITFSANAQSYEAKYKMIYESSKIGNTADSIKEISRNLFLRIVIIYTVTTDGEYLLVKGEQEETSSILGSSINIQASDTEVICDLAKQLIYFPESGKFQRIKKYVLSKDTVTDGRHSIVGFDSSYLVILNDSLKSYISPALFFSNNKFGVQKIYSPDFTMELITPLKNVNKKLSYEMLFRKADNMKIDEEYAFFQ